MALGKNFLSVLSSIAIGISSALPSYARSEKIQPKTQEVKYIELSERNRSFSRDFPVELTQRQAAKTVNVGDSVISVQGEMDYKSEKFTLSYSSGKMTSEGPDLRRFSRKQRERLPVSELVPRLNDGETDIYIVSLLDPNRGFELNRTDLNRRRMSRAGNDNFFDPAFIKYSEKGYFYPENEVRSLIRLEEHWQKKLAMDAGKKGLDKLIEYGDAKIPFAKRVKPLKRVVDYFEEHLAREQMADQQIAKKSLEGSVSVERIPLGVDSHRGIAPRHMIARTIELQLSNLTFEDQPKVVYLRRIGIGERTKSYGELKDVAIKMNLPSRLKDYLGSWLVTHINSPCPFEGRQGLNRQIFTINPKNMEIKTNDPISMIPPLVQTKVRRIFEDGSFILSLSDEKSRRREEIYVQKKCPKRIKFFIIENPSKELYSSEERLKNLEGWKLLERVD